MDEHNSTPKPETPVPADNAPAADAPAGDAPAPAPAPAAAPAPAPAPAGAPASPLREWPGAFGAYKPSSAAVRRNLTTIVILIVLSLAAGVIVGLVFGKIRWLSDIVSLLVGALFSGAQTLTYIASVRGRTVEVSDIIKQALPMVFKMFLLNLLVGASIVGGLILFIVPAFFILPRLILAPYYLMDQKLGVIEAYSASWKGSKGYSGKMYGLIGVTFLMLLPIITIIGIVVSVYWLVLYSCAIALLYQFILDHPAEPAPEAAPAPAAPAAN